MGRWCVLPAGNHQTSLSSEVNLPGKEPAFIWSYIYMKTIFTSAIVLSKHLQSSCVPQLHALRTGQVNVFYLILKVLSGGKVFLSFTIAASLETRSIWKIGVMLLIFLKKKIRGKKKECSNYFGVLHMPYRYQWCQWLTPKTLRSTY